MRCKPGDLAIVVSSDCGNEGKIVRCLRLHTSVTHDLDGATFSESASRRGPRWVVDPPLPVVYESGRHCFALTCADSALRPLRPEREPSSVTTEDTASA